MTPLKKINLALQGGGSHGAITWGVADRLLEDERLEIEAISGASAGAVNAVAIAYGLHIGGRDGARATLDRLWADVSRVGALYSPVRGAPAFGAGGFGELDYSPAFLWFDAFTRMFSPYQFNPFNINPLKMLLEDIVDFEALSNCKRTKLFLSATNVRTGKVKVFSTQKITSDVVLASACLPFLFKAVEIDGEAYWDGGYMGNPVLFPFFYEAETRDVVIAHVNPIERDKVPMTAPEIMNRINEISFNSSLMRELRAIAFVHKLLDDGWLKDDYRDRLRDIRIHSIRSDKALKRASVASKFATDENFLADLKAKGRAMADEWLSENFDALGHRSSVDLRAMFE